MDRIYSYKDNCGFGLLANLNGKESHKTTLDAITALERMMHRGAIAADGKSGDGCGLLFSLPKDFMREKAREGGVSLPEDFAVAMVFLKSKEHVEKFEEICLANDLKVAFRREVPIDKTALGKLALATLPKIMQFFIIPNTIIAKKFFHSLLYLTRRKIQMTFREDDDFYICSMSERVVIYKGLVMPTFIKTFYKDLAEPAFKTSFALFHQRFSTNTLPKWRLAQPFRTLAHNGEINSINANRANLAIEEKCLKSHRYTAGELKTLLPITGADRSDSASLDNLFEFLIANDVDFFKAVRLVLPAPWQNNPYIDSKIRSFYEYTSTHFAPWDGPAAVSFTDGRFIACCLDRNGLRPAKYIITKDGRALISSEYGVLDIAEADIAERGRLQSGQMIGLDLKYGKIMRTSEIDDYIKDTQDYTKWLNENMIHLEEYVDLTFEQTSDYRISNLNALQREFGVTLEFKEMLLEPMIKTGKEATGSMGDDTALAAFSTQFRRFGDYFKQKLAQVTNPPIDPLREMVVMSLNVTFGEYRNFLEEKPHHAKRIKTISPILMQEKFAELCKFGDEKNPKYHAEFKNQTFSVKFEKDLKKSLENLVAEVSAAVKNGVHIVILSDRDVDETHAAIPMAMAVGRVHTALIASGLRHKISIIAQSGDALDSHSIAMMIGFGANAVYPYLLFASALETLEKSGADVKAGLKNVHHALNAGLLKIMSKMGISTVGSYKYSALFDVLGLSERVVNECFAPAACLLPGLDYKDIEERILRHHREVFKFENHLLPIELGGFYRYLEGGEFHDYSPFVINQIHKIAASGEEADFAVLRETIKNRGKQMVRDFLDIKSDRKPIKISQVEPASEILKRFNTAAMSLGSIGQRAHEVLAEAMNRLGAMSNSGEGGESSERMKSPLNSKIKQIASARFGVTPEYLASAEEIQIKLAQGAKPGEGGQLPGYKVTPLIATLRYTTPGVTLISPPPHHDIYSIEDLAQLIFDLKQVNPRAKIAVKLVSSAGVGTIAAGVAKCYADKIIISGGNGGTGAASMGSIKFAGNPWELGLIEAHNALKANNLRSLVHLQTDGGLKIGLDIIKAALLGAESYAFGTLALVILGCKVLRICHLNKCTEGVATQDPELASKFKGDVDKVVNYFTLLAQDVRAELAAMGYKSLDAIVGRNDLLVANDSKFDLSELTRVIEGPNKSSGNSNEPFDKNEFEKKILKEVYRSIENPSQKTLVTHKIHNQNRSFGALISGEIAKFYGAKGLATKTITINLEGVSGQSLGAFLSPGMAIYLTGSANDYVGKGMSGGRIVVRPQEHGQGFAVAGNTCLYGATGGKFFGAGLVGERFCVRNSGATAVVEGVGDHACEYMTGGVVVILGQTGINFGAGMTGGLAFVWDEKHDFIDKLNQELVVACRIDTDENEEARYFLKRLLRTYYDETLSARAGAILSDFRDHIREFWMVRPKDMTKLPLNPAEGD